MILRDGRFALDAHRVVHRDCVVVENGRFNFSAAPAGNKSLDLSGYLILPGLINAHDHLEFNLFPKLGDGFYKNAADWAQDIYQTDRDPVGRHQALLKPVRLVWGGLKSLMSGVTTVAHHNPYEPMFEEEFPVRVVRRYGWAHSLDFSPDIAKRFHDTPASWPFITHAAEGTDLRARLEIQRLDELGILTGHTVLVHAVATDQTEWALLVQRGTSVVWCPTSNLEMLGTTIHPEAHKSGVKIALGTDSAITAQTNLASEISVARREHDIPPCELYTMVTRNPATILHLGDGEGHLRHGGFADFIAVKDYGQSPAEALLDLRLEAVAVGGEVRLASEAFSLRVSGSRFHRFNANSRIWYTSVDMPALFRQTTPILGPHICLAGIRVSPC